MRHCSNLQIYISCNSFGQCDDLTHLPQTKTVLFFGIDFSCVYYTTDHSVQLDVLWHDGNPLGVDGAEVGVLEESHKVSLAGLLQSHHSRALEAQVSLEILGDLTNQPLEGQLADQQLSRLLVPGLLVFDAIILLPSDLPEGDCARPVTVGLLDSSSCRSRLAGSLGCQLLPE